MGRQAAELIDALQASSRTWAKYGATLLVDAIASAVTLAQRERPSSAESLDGELTVAAEALAREAIQANTPLMAAAILGAVAIKLGSSTLGLAKGLSMRKRAFDLCLPILPHSYELAVLAITHADAEQNTAAKICTLDAAIEALSILSGRHAAAFHPQAAHLLFLCYMKRGNAKSSTASLGVMAALEDLDRAVAVSDQFARTMPAAITHAWRSDLAAIFSNRAQVKESARGYGPKTAIEDYDRAIEIRQTLANELGGKFPADWRARHAISFLNRANAKKTIRTVQPTETLADYDQAVETLATVLQQPESPRHEDWRNWLAMAHMNRADVRAKGEDSGKRAALEDLTACIGLLNGIIQRCGEHTPDDFRNNLAAAHANRAQLLAKIENHRLEDVIADCDRSIEIYRGLLEKHGARAPSTWRNHLAKVLNNRAIRRRSLESFGSVSALEDYDAALAIWREDKLARHFAQEFWLSTQVGAAVCRIECGSLQEAAELLEAAALEFRQLVAESVLREEQKTHMHGGRGIAKWGAWLYAQLGEPERALSFLETQRSQFLKESLLSNPTALSVRLGRERANAIVELQASIRNLRLKELKDARNGLNAEERERLIAMVRSLTEMLEQAERERALPAFTADSIADLAPSGGALLVPVTVRLGTTVFVVRRDRPVTFVSLRNLGTPRLEAWAESFFKAEAHYIERGASAAAFGEFDAELVAQTRQYWDEFIGPLTRELEDTFGIPHSAPLTFATQGALDALPIHAAWRDENGARRHLIEDRVVRFAPGLTALSLMRQRTLDEQRGAAGERSLAAFVAPVWSGISAREQLTAARDIEWPRVSALPWARIHGPFVGENATAEAFLTLMHDAATAPTMTDVLLSTHAFFDPVTPENSALVFAAANGRKTSLSVADLLALKPVRGLDHVAMPACRSAQSGLQRIPDESIGLVSAMIQAGAASVLSCLYSVADDVAAELVPKFFEQRMATGKDIAEVVRDTVIARQTGAEPSQPRVSAIRLSIAAPPSATTYPARCLADWAAFKPICSG